MQARSFSPIWVAAPRTFGLVAREVYVTWRFTYRDLSASTIPGFIFLLAALHGVATSLASAIPTVAWGLIYFFFYIYPFCVANQIVGVEEDRINKPDRPLPAGLVTLRGAYARWWVGMALYTLVGWWLGVLAWTLLWQAVMVLYNFGGWGKRWYFKDLSMGLGTLVQLGAAWQIVTPITPIAWSWICFGAVAVYLLISLQDIRDLEGDRLTGRRTLPIAWGELRVRALLAVGFALLPLMFYLVLLQPFGLSLIEVATLVPQVALCSVTAVRIWLWRTAKADHRTYMLFTYWHCVFVSSAILLI